MPRTTIEEYIVLKGKNDSLDSGTSYGEDYDAAKDEAQDIKGCVVAMKFTFDDSELVDDFTQYVEEDEEEDEEEDDA